MTYYKTENGLVEENPDEEKYTFENVLEIVGSSGKWQKKIFILASISQVYSAMNAVAAVFISAIPDHQCSAPLIIPYNSTLFDVGSPMVPKDYKCQMYNHNYSAIEDVFKLNQNPTLDDVAHAVSNDSTYCNAWDYDPSLYYSTVTTEWSLVCSKRWMAPTVQAVYMIGILFGSLIFGQVSDRIGRRPTILFCVVSLTITGVSAAFINEYFSFLVLRFLIAMECAGMMVTNFVLVVEVMSPKSRTSAGMLNGIPFGFGISLITVFAYFLRHWRHLQFLISILTLFLFIYFWYLPESPRWLVSKGRSSEALKILKKIAEVNGKSDLPPDEELILYLRQPGSMENDKSTKCRCTFFKDQWTLIRTPVMRRRCLIGFFMWFVSAMVYYGLIFSGSSIQVNPYLSVFVSGFVEIPAFAFGALILVKFGRRIVSCGLLVICSFFLLVILAVPTDKIYIVFALSNTGKFFNAAVFQLCYLYTSELVPTHVRNVAVGTSSMMGRVGSSIAPYILDLLGEIHFTIPSLVFGILSLTAGLLTLLLPETLNKPLPATIEEVEKNKR